MSKLDIKTEMAALDSKNRKFYDNLTDEERKGFSLYLMLRWGASVKSNREVERYYLMSCNERLNKHFFSIAKFPKLQWLCATTISPGIGNQYHEWISHKNTASNKKVRKFIEQNFPHLNQQEIELLEAINDTSDFKNLAKQLGYDDKRIKDELG